MTPAARLSAAIELLDTILGGQPAGLTLTNWGRQSRYAGSRDRAAVRDIVFDCLRSRRSLEFSSGRSDGRGLVTALAHQQDLPLENLFTGEKYAPAPLTDEEQNKLAQSSEADDPVRLNYPDFLDVELKASLGGEFETVMSEMSRRAPVDLRVNRMRSDVDSVIASLAVDHIEVERVPTVQTALRVVENPRRVSQSAAYKDGLVELQDASSQAATWFADAEPGMQILDYCAGGGGKTLALYDAIKGVGSVTAHDIATVRMNDLPVRAARAGARISIARPGHKSLVPEGFDLVFVDAPCSGSGSWRRTPDAKWRFSKENLDNLLITQREILDRAAGFVRSGGVMNYATCSMLNCENTAQVEQFLSRNSDFELDRSAFFSPPHFGDGFFSARLIKK